MSKDNYNLNAGLKFINPYNFVPVNGVISRLEGDREDAGNQSSVLHSGVLHCSLYAKTDLIIPDASEKEIHEVCVTDPASGKKKKETLDRFPFMKVDNELIIPAGSLRGPIRSVYEAVTNSCYPTLRQDQMISTRSQAEENSTMCPGILYRRNGEWTLSKATEYRVGKELLGNMKYGQTVKFNYQSVTGTNRKGKEFNYLKVTEFSETGEKSGYVFRGEYIGGKKTERIFESGDLLKTKNDQLNIAVRRLQQLLKEYQDIYDDKRKRQKLPKQHGAYTHIHPEFFDQDERHLPVWYRFSAGKCYLSLACIGRYAYQHTLNDVLNRMGGYAPCSNPDKACPACILFGMVGGKEGGRVGKVRFTDAHRVDKGGDPHYSILKELGQPHITYLPFYTVNGKEYDDEGVSIRGRKFYWHHKPDAGFYQAGEDEINKMTSEMEILDATTETGTDKITTTFKFDVYYDRITEKERQELAWILCLGDNHVDSDLCHKIGHAKPFGFGSVKIIIDGFEERTFGDQGYVITEGSAEELEYDHVFKEKRETASFKALMQVLNFSTLSGLQASTPVRYPYIDPNGFTRKYVEVEERNGEKKRSRDGSIIKDIRYVNADGIQKPVNDFASHQWYGKFRFDYNKRERSVSILPLATTKTGEISYDTIVMPAAQYELEPPKESGQRKTSSKGTGPIPNRGSSSGSAGSGKLTKSFMIKLTEEEEAAGYMAGKIVDKGKKGNIGHVQPYNTDEKVFLHEQYCITPISQLKVGDHVIFKKEENQRGTDPFRAVEVHVRQ